jgi:hypothetical protein
MRASLARHGQLTPVRAFDDGRGLEVFDGFKCVRAMRALGRSKGNGLRSPAGGGVVGSHDEEHARAAEASAQRRDVDRPAPVLVGVGGELHLDDDRKDGASMEQQDDEILSFQSARAPERARDI